MQLFRKLRTHSLTLFVYSKQKNHCTNLQKRFKQWKIFVWKLQIVSLALVL